MSTIPRAHTATPPPGSAQETPPALTYDEVIVSAGIRVPFVPEIVTPAIEKPLRSGRYEGGERRNLDTLLRPDDRLLDLGAGLGLISTVAAKQIGGHAITSVEANPALIPVIEETHRLNEIEGVTILNAVALTGEVDGSVPFYLRKDFWASSMEPDSRAYVAVADVPAIPISALMSDARPTVICCDIEGGELGLFDEVDLSGVRALILELHPKVYGQLGVQQIDAVLADRGFLPTDPSHSSTVTVYERPAPPAPARVSAQLDPAEWPIAEPRTLIATCMKDEGPFILEWLAWHKAIGVTDFVVFSNDCTDGTDRLLDRLDAMGELHHLPNPASATGSSYFQPTALSYVSLMRPFREADFFISMDVDEFLNIRVGDGRLPDLFAATEPFDVLSVTENNHGSNRHEHFEPGWVTELFPKHSTETPGQWKAHRGVKSIVRLSDRIAKVRNHRPDLHPDLDDPVWLDGSGIRRAEMLQEADRNGHDCRGSYDLVVLNHFALRSLESYLMKMFRGDVVRKGHRVSQRYWRIRNQNGEASIDLSRGIAMAREVHARYEADAELMALHDACCAAHRARIAELLGVDEFRERREWILNEQW